MKIYVAALVHPHEFSELLGAFSTFGKAKAFLDANYMEGEWRKNPKNGEWEKAEYPGGSLVIISEFEVDAVGDGETA